MIRKICEFSLSLNDVHRPDWASTTMPADLVDVSVLSQDGRLRLGSSSSQQQQPSVTEQPTVVVGTTSDAGNQTTRSCHCPQWTLKRPRHWVYRGEGNASIVLALPQEKKIVKLAKIDYKLRRMDSDNQFVAQEVNGGIRTIDETLERLFFSQKILGSLLGDGLVRPCQVCHVDLEEIEEVDHLIDVFRPAHRKHKRLAPVCHVIVCPDCTLLPPAMSTATEQQQLLSLPVTCNNNQAATATTVERQSAEPPVFCVELKPKQGFLSQGHQHCPFCLNQFLKRKHGKIQLLSQYCPLDLFSGSRLRMLKAIVALTRTPQNNLRIFQDGNLVFAEECQNNLLPVLQQWFQLDDTSDRTLPLKHFCTLVMEALTMEICDGPTDQSVQGVHCPALEESELEDWNALMREQRGDHSLPCLPPVVVTTPECNDSWLLGSCNTRLPSRSVLCRLLRVQSLGDVDFERLYDAYDALVGRFRDGSVPYETMRWTHPHTGTADWLLSQEKTSDQTMDDVRLVQRYRISSTTRDCSIMIAFQRRLDPSAKRATSGAAAVEELPVVRDLSGHVYKCHASVVDLDPKPVTCVEKHRRRNLAMNEAFWLSNSDGSSHSSSVNRLPPPPPPPKV
ncbi:inositol-pentakisphosphate 2-kinase-like isoform X1 [Daphnia pulex]|uniref:inositol-pentakisphosphate 2-kinase-like isoform X1 n=1 Tax=Daphnia pulex TaxID=6669 RepID=UPI001EDF8F4D|nr:inositol-pentakisphosphate 2-kinase-like isoform X1 [Daphnia pulex]